MQAIFDPTSDEYQKERIRRAYARLYGGEITDPTPTPPQKPREGFIKNKGKGWGAKKDAIKWIVERMNDRPKLFKVVDKDTGKNVATDFSTLETARQYVDYFIWEQTKDKPLPPPKPTDPTKPIPIPEGPLDNSGVLMIYKTAPNAQQIYNDDVEYKRSSHGGDERDTIYKSGFSPTNIEQSGYYKIKASDPSDELSHKHLTGKHTGKKGSKEAHMGRCYVLGIEFKGGPHFAKEYPTHPTTPNFSDEVAFPAGLKNVGNILDKWVGMKTVNYLKDGVMYFEVYFDGPYDELPDPLPNNWKLFYVAIDNGKNLTGEVLTENQGNKYGDSAQFYIRIDTVTDKTEWKGISAREIIPPDELPEWFK